MLDAKQYWNTFYEKKSPGTTDDPNTFLVSMIPRLQKGKVFEVAMGDGANGVFLAQNGFEVKGIDISDVAIDLARKRAKKSGVVLDVQDADLDLYLFGLMEFDSIVMTQFRPALTRYYPEILRSLKQGGTLLVDSLLVDEMDEAIGKDEQYRNIYFGPNELLSNLAGLQILFYQEGEVDGQQRVQCLAKKPVDRDSIRYKNVFETVVSGDLQEGKSKHQELMDKLFKD
jgi:SAM-dependent methyltransferase